MTDFKREVLEGDITPSDKMPRRASMSLGVISSPDRRLKAVAIHLKGDDEQDNGLIYVAASWNELHTIMRDLLTSGREAFGDEPLLEWMKYRLARNEGTKH